MAKIHISKPGKFKSAEGVDIEITPAILSEVAQTYNPTAFEAQLVIGHPKMDAPSFGGVKALSFGSDGLMADTEPTDDAVDLVSKRHFKSVSASFYTPTAPNNPTPGKWHLRHVGLLGAAAPAVKGLRALSFAEAEEGVVTFGELPAYAGYSISRILRNLREWFIAEKGQDVADRVLPDWEVESIREISQRAQETSTTEEHAFQGGTPALAFADGNGSNGNAATHTPNTASFSTASQEMPTMKTVEQLQAELNAANQEVATLKAAEAKRAADTRHAEHVSFCEQLVAEAKIPAAMKDVIAVTLDELASKPGVVSFGEGDQEKPLHEALKDQLKAMPASVSFGEFAKKPAGSADVVSFSEQPGYAGVQVDADRAQLDKKIKNYMAEHKVDYVTAAAFVSL